MIEIAKGGSVGLGKLDYLYNPTTQEFLLKSGLKSGMKVLDIGCGSGVMTCWIADQIGKDGLSVGIENDENQLNAAKHRAQEEKLSNTKFVLCSAYDLEQLDEQFDFVYCRFLLHHLHDVKKVIDKIYQVLKPGGIYAAEEGIVNYAFTYPHSDAWGNEETRLPPVWTDYPVGNRDPNVGVKLVTKMKQAGFIVNQAKVIHPVMITREEKKLLLLGIEEFKPFFLSQGHTETDWQSHVLQTQAIVDNDEQIAAFYGSCQVAGKRHG